MEQFFRSLRLLDIAQRDRTGLGLLGQDKIASRLREALGGDLTFDQLKLPLALVAVDLETGEEVIIREGSVVEALLATAAVPILFPPVRWRDRLLVDGGVLNPVPFDVVRRMGADTDVPIRVIAVYTKHDLSGELGAGTAPGGRSAEAVIRTLLHRAPWAPIVDVAERSNSIMSRRLIEQRMQDAPPDLMIEVLFQGVGLLDLDQVDRCIKLGEEAARQHLPELLELRDTLPSRWRRWWCKLRQRLPG
jgi:NTE family protein